MQRYKCIIEYDGTNFSGWQRQADQSSIQQCLEEAIFKFSGETVTIHVAGRTDAGVHAFGQVMHFDIEKSISAEKIMGAMNFHLKPNPISVIGIEEASEEFHARFSAQKRHYIYRIINRRAPLAIEHLRAWHIGVPLDVDKMRQAANNLIGTHDFSSFRDSQCQGNTPIKTLDEIKIERSGDLITIEVCAKSFLHHMVRNIAGTLKFAGEGKWSANEVKKILEAKDRTKAGPTAPAYGLFFVKVDY